jgi:coenzyme PQQ precursor peptide PqqA
MRQSRGWSRDSHPKKGWNEMVRVWSKPVIVEIAVGMEINCYACAELD